MTTTHQDRMTTGCLHCLGTGRDATFGDACAPCGGTGQKATALSLTGTGTAPSTRSYTGGATHQPATDKQLGYLTSLMAQLGANDAAGAVQALVAAGAGRVAISRAIDIAQADLAKRGPVAGAAPAANRPARANQYAGRCTRCGQDVAAGAGTCAKVDGRWVVAHHDGDCPAAPAAAPTADVPAGHYAVPSATGANDLEYFRVDHTDSGRTYVKLVIGGHPEYNARGAHAARLLAAVAEHGVEHSARLYGQTIGRCCRCNRTLTDQVSRAAGIGPECAKA